MMKMLSLLMFSSFFSGKALLILLFIDYVCGLLKKPLFNHEILPAIFVVMLCMCMVLSYLSRWRYAAVLMMKISSKVVDVYGNDKVRVDRILQRLVMSAQERGISKLELSDIMVLVDDSDNCNAWALGSNVIVISRAALGMNDDMLRGLLAHELGHLINGDQKFLEMFAGALVPWAVYLPVAIVNNVFAWIASIPFILFSILSVIVTIPVGFLKLALAVCDDVLNLILNVVRRKSEYAADRVAVEIGAKRGLRQLLCFFREREPRRYFWSIGQYFGTHPQLEKRIGRIELM